MKKYLIIPFIVLFAFSCWAISPAFLGLVGDDSGLGSCPSYYASAILSMDFNHSSGILVACNTAGAEVTFTDSGADIGAYGETGNGLKIDALNEDIYFDQSGGQYFDEDADQTICLRIKKTGTPDNETGLWKADDTATGTDDDAQINIFTDDALYCHWYTQDGADDAVGGNTIDENSWETIGWSFEGASIDTDADQTANPGDQTPWANAWEDDVDDLDAMTNAPTRIWVGSNAGGEPTDTTIIIDSWAIFAGYKVNCSTYMPQ